MNFNFRDCNALQYHILVRVPGVLTDTAYRYFEFMRIGLNVGTLFNVFVALMICHYATHSKIVCNLNR